MRVVGIMEFGGPEVLEIVELPEPHAGPGELRIRVRAAAVNPTDTLKRTGVLRAEGPPPYVPGLDIAGVVDEIGEGTTTELAVGDHAMAVLMPEGWRGGYSEYVVVPAASAAAVPAGATDVEAATLPMNAMTARLALDALELEPGQTLAVTGAAGAVGGYAVQLGKADGLRVVADASDADEQLVRQLGADVIVRRGDDVAERIRAVVPEGVDGLVDGALMDDLVTGAVRDGGRVASVRGYRGGTEPERGITFHPVAVRTYLLEHEKLDTMRRQVEAGEVTLRVARTFSPEKASDAHRLLEAGGTRGRIVLEF